jgi:hypothetical protein
MSDIDLAFATSDELIDELKKRHSALVLCRIELIDNKNFRTDACGPLSTLIGLGAFLQKVIDKQVETAIASPPA